MDNDTFGYPLELFIEQWSHDKFGNGNFRERLYEYLEDEMGVSRASSISHHILNEVFSRWAPAYLAYFPIENDIEASVLWYFLHTLVAKFVLTQPMDTNRKESPSILWEKALSKLSDADKNEVQRYSVDWEKIEEARQKISECLPPETVDWLFSDLYALKKDSEVASTPHQKYKKLMQEQLTNLLLEATKE